MSELRPPSARSLIAVVDDDAPTCQSVQRLLKAHGFDSLAYQSAASFMASGRLSEFGCLILDVRMPGLSGPELQDCLLKADVLLPIIFVTGYIDDVVKAGTRKAGTVKILEKPFQEDELIAHVKAALQVFK